MCWSLSHRAATRVIMPAGRGFGNVFIYQSRIKLNDDLGLPDDPATKALSEFVAEVLKQ